MLEEFRDKILFFGVPLFVLFFIVTAIFADNDCEEIYQSLGTKVNYIKKVNTIDKIVLDKLEGSNQNFTETPIEITDKMEIEAIRRALIERSYEPYNHPRREGWDLMMRFFLTNGEILEIEICKMNNGKGRTAHINLYTDYCIEEKFAFSNSLLKHIETFSRN